MTYTDKSYRENNSGKFRKKFKGLSAIGNLSIPKNIWVPEPGEIYMITEAYYIRVDVRASDGSLPAPTTPPQIRLLVLTTSITGIVPLLPTDKILRIVFSGGNPQHSAFTNASPLKVNLAAEAAGGILPVVWLYDLVIVATKLHD